MNPFLSVLVSILEIIVILGVLISLHEAGHLGMAKAFNVYCFEYSIGFGPKILRKKRKNGETYFCIGVVPLGGYVSMYGEEGAVPEGMDEPDPSRSLRNIKKWKQAIIMVAGVTVNFVLGLILIFISNIAFPQYYYGYGASQIQSNSTTVSTSFATVSQYGNKIIEQIDVAIAGNPALADTKPNEYVIPFPAVLYQGTTGQSVFITDGVVIDGTANERIAAYYPSSLIDEHTLASSILFYPETVLTEENAYYEALHNQLGYDAIVSKSDVENANYFQVKNVADGTKVTINMRLMPLSFLSGETRESIDFVDVAKNKSANVQIILEAKGGKWVESEGYGVKISVISGFLGWNRAWQAWASDVPYACGAIVQGIGSIFTQGFKNLSGIVGITAALPTITATGGAARIFFMAGMLSINLCFFNLIPFPGLDGWQLLTLAVEGIFRKEIPSKVKNTISFVGLILLFGLMIFITVKDIIGLF